MGQYSRILECAGCGATVEVSGFSRIDFWTREAHSCRRADPLDNLTERALAGQTDLDFHVADAVEALLLDGHR